MGRFKSAYLMVIFGFLYLPMAVLALYSFNPSKYGIRWEGFTLDWYRNLAADASLVEAAFNSLLVASLAASLASAVGTLGAVGLYRYRFTGRKALQGLLFVTLMSPDMVMAVSLLVLFVALHVHLGFWSLLLSHTTFCLPFVTVTVLSRLDGFDRHLLEAAADLGAGEWRALRQIVLPLAMPAILAGWLLSFTLSLDDVVVSFFVTGPGFEVLPLKIYAMVRLGVKPEVNALATLLFAVSLALVSGAQRVLQRQPGHA
jgi:spermidine/putrescine transport system permease protein